jgi:hypothetical protein
LNCSFKLFTIHVTSYYCKVIKRPLIVFDRISKYLQGVVDVPESAHPIQLAFLVYSAIKRAVVSAGRSRSGCASHPILPATDLTKKLLGLHGKEMVRDYSWFKRNASFTIYMNLMNFSFTTM